MKRIITVVVGYAIMAYMVYLIMVTARSTPKIWDPYDILGISRVRVYFLPSFPMQGMDESWLFANIYFLFVACRVPTKKRSLDTTSAFR